MTDNEKLKLQCKLSGLHTEFEFFRRKSTKKLDDMTASYNESDTYLAQSAKLRAQYYVETWQLSSRVDGFKIEKATSDRTFCSLQHDYDGALAKEIWESDALKTVRASVEGFVVITICCEPSFRGRMICSERTSVRALLH